MRLTAGYDRDFAAQFFRRTFYGLAPDGVVPGGKILPLEVEYMAMRLAETVVFPAVARLGCPWYTGNPASLAEATRHTEDRWLLQRAETAGNNMVILEGLVTRGGLVNIRADQRRSRYEKDPPNRQKLAGVLYRHASNWHGHTEASRFVLRRLSANVQTWVQLLSMVSGNDYLEMLATRASSLLVVPGQD